MNENINNAYAVSSHWNKKSLNSVSPVPLEMFVFTIYVFELDFFYASVWMKVNSKKQESEKENRGKWMCTYTRGRSLKITNQGRRKELVIMDRLMFAISIFQLIAYSLEFKIKFKNYNLFILWNICIKTTSGQKNYKRSLLLRITQQKAKSWFYK